MTHHHHEKNEFKSRVILGEYRTPGMALWLMKHFPGIVKTERQAGSFLLVITGFVLLAMVGVLSGTLMRVIAPAYYGSYRQSSGDMRYQQERAPAASYRGR